MTNQVETDKLVENMTILGKNKMKEMVGLTDQSHSQRRKSIFNNIVDIKFNHFQPCTVKNVRNMVKK